jgi:hypothetical protein
MLPVEDFPKKFVTFSRFVEVKEDAFSSPAGSQIQAAGERNCIWSGMELLCLETNDCRLYITVGYSRILT